MSSFYWKHRILWAPKYFSFFYYFFISPFETFSIIMIYGQNGLDIHAQFLFLKLY